MQIYILHRKNGKTNGKEKVQKQSSETEGHDILVWCTGRLTSDSFCIEPKEEKPGNKRLLT